MTGPKKGITANRKTEDKLSYIVENYYSMNKDELSKAINETPQWVKRQIKLLKLSGLITNKRSPAISALSDSNWLPEIKQHAIDLRLNKLKSSKEISEILSHKFNFNYPDYTIEHWLLHKFKCNQPSKEEWLYKFLPYNMAKDFLEKGWKIIQISKHLKDVHDVYISDDYILTYLNKIGLNSLKNYRNESINKKSKEFSKEWIEKKINSHSGLRGLSEEMGVSKTIVMKRIKEENLSLIKHRIQWSYDLDSIRDLLLNVPGPDKEVPLNDVHQMILGWLLGDGSLSKTGLLTINHTLHQLGYLYVKIRILKKYVSSVFTVPSKIVTKDKIFSESEDQLGFSCAGLNDYTKYLNLDGSKNYSMIMQELNDIGWSCYFMDDGSLLNVQIMCMGEDKVKMFQNRFKFGDIFMKSNLIIKGIRNEFLLPAFYYKTKDGSNIGSYWNNYIKDIFDVKKIENILDLSIVNAYVVKNNSTILNNAVYYYQNSYGFPFLKVCDPYLNKQLELLRNFDTKYLWKKSNILKQTYVGDSIFKNFMPHIAEAKSKGISPMDLFSNFSAFRGILDKTLFEKKSILPKFVYNSLFFNSRGVSGFPCGIAKALVDKFCPEFGTVVDPCAGWGGRLLGTISSNKKYIGFEPWDKTVIGLNKIISFIETKNATVVPSEFCVEKAPESCDLIFTSPPYMDFEFYGKPITKESWEVLMKAIFLYAEKSLAVGGHLLLNLPRYLKDMLPKTTLTECLPIYWFSSSRKKDISKAEIIFIWIK